MSPSAADSGTSSSAGEPATRIAAARQSGPVTARLLNLMAMLAPRPVPVELLGPEIDRRPPGSGTGDGRTRDVAGAVRRLVELDLLRTHGGGSRVQMPEHVQSVVREALPGPVASGALEAGVRVIREGVHGRGRIPHRALLPHAVALAERTADLGRAPDRALALAGRLLAGAGSEEVERPLLAASARLQEVAQGSRVLEDPFLRAALADQHAGLLAAAGETEEACRRAESAIREGRAILAGEDDPRLALLHYNAGGLYKGMGRPEEGVSHFRRARRLLEADAADGSMLAPRVLVDLAECLLMADRPEEAREVAPAAVAACTQRFGPDHPETAAARGAARRAEEESGGAPPSSTPGKG